MTPEYSLYFHVPFCAHRCAYCDFNTYAGQESSIPAYVHSLCNEIKIVGGALARLRARAGSEGEIHTIFFGGGTPSLLTSAQFQDIFQTIHQFFDVTPDAEISLEANPGTVSPSSLRDLRQIGFNRISYGVQSANPEELRMLERIHGYSDVVDAVRWSRQAGFDNLNLDLIYGLPEQTLERWQHTVKLIVGLRPEHISAYALTIEHSTPFGRWAAKGLLPIPDPDVAADQYEWTMEFLAGKGYVQYEISNWALLKDEGGIMKDEEKPSEFILHNSSFACRHNLQYWRNLDYLGLGAGAHGYTDGVRYSNVLRIKTYIERISEDALRNTHYDFPLSPATVNSHHNTSKDDMQETMMTGLRLTQEGVAASVFQRRFGVDLMGVFGKEIGELVKFGLLEWVGESPSPGGRWAGVRVRLTPRGRLLGNQVFMRFVGE